MSARGFPFGRESTGTATPLPPSEPRMTDPLVGFVPSGQVLPFRATERPASPASSTAPSRRRVAARPRPRLARKVAVALVLLAVYVAVLWLILAPRGP